MRSVLIVDDEFGIVDVLVTALEDEGYRVFSASNGRRGLERMAENRPDLVLADFMMPLMDGTAMAHAMRADPAYRDIPIIMMSSVPEASIRERFDGYQGFLLKPFSLAKLTKLIAVVLSPEG